MSSYTEYITKTGDRWDTITYQAYGDVYRWRDILRANPTLPILDEYPSGVRITIPIIADADSRAEVNKSKLPPWKR